MVWPVYPQSAYSLGKGVKIGIGVAFIELLAEPLRMLAVVAELRVQLAEETKGDGPRTAGPSEVVPEEAQAIRRRGGALGLDLVLAEPAKTADLAGAATQPKHTGKVVHDLLDVQRAGKDTELHHTDEPAIAVTLERFSKIHHAAPALLGALGFDPLLLAGDDLAHVLGGLLVERMAVVVEVTVRSRLAVEAARVPAGDVGKFANELAHRFRVGRADDRLNAHGDVAATGCVHAGTDGIEPFNEGDQMNHAMLAVEDGRHKLAGHLPGVAANGAIALGLPRISVEGRRVAADTGSGASGGDRIPAVVTAHRHLAGGRQARFEFDAPLDEGGFRISGFHEDGMGAGD